MASTPRDLPASRVLLDDLGVEVAVPAGPAVVERVVSLVPSLTEALASVRRTALVGVTDWCTHPGDLAAARVRGTKNPDLAAIEALAPDLVIANQEENRELDVRRLRERGVPVWVTRIETVPEAIESMQRLFDEALGWPRPDWLAAARDLWCGEPAPARARTATCIWRDPWMVVGRDNFTSDLLGRAGLPNVFANHPVHTGRYPAVPVAEIDAAGADLVLLPDEPYVFHAGDGPEAFRTPTRLVEGRLLTWYGPSLLDAWAELSRW